MGAAHGGFEIEAVVNWAWCKMGAAHYGIDIKVVGNWARGALGYWNQGSRPLGLMQDGRRSLRDWNQGGWWLGMMSTLHYDIEIKVGRQLGLMQDWAPHITVSNSRGLATRPDMQDGRPH